MPPSKTRTEDTYEAFHTDETFTSVANRLGVCRLTLKRWWIAKFGEQAFLQKTTREKVSKEEKKQNRREYRTANRERINATKRSWIADNPEPARKWRTSNPEKVRGYNQNYYWANTERERARARKYGAENRQLRCQKEKDYYTKYPEKLLIKFARKRAKDYGVPINITSEDIRALIPLDNICPITLQPFERGVGKVGPRSMSLDRIVPELGYVHGNVAVISHIANTIKQDCTDPDVFCRLARYIEKGSSIRRVA